MSSVVYLWSQYSPISVSYLSFIHAKRGRSLCVDHPTIREIIKGGNIKVNEIPCILVSSGGQISQYEGNTAVQWIEAIKSQEARPLPPQNIPPPPPQQEPQLPQLNFQMAGERTRDNKEGRENLDDTPQISQIPQIPRLPQQMSPQGIPSGVTPISQIIPEGETQEVNIDPSKYNQQAMNYYNQFANAEPQTPNVRQKQLSPKEMEMQRMLEIAKQNMPDDEDGNSIIGSRN